MEALAARLHLVRNALAICCGDAKAILARLAGESLDENRGALEEPVHWLDLQQLADLLVCLPRLLEERFVAMEDALLSPARLCIAAARFHDRLGNHHTAKRSTNTQSLGARDYIPPGALIKQLI